MADEPKVDEPIVTESTTQLNLASEVEFAPNAQAIRFYANHVQANITLFEIRLILNFVSGVNAKGHLIGQESLMVSLSPELTYAVHALLGRTLESYRRQFGELRIPPLKTREGEAASKEPTPEEH